ncbi:hypothetical protein IQ266_22545 [filamentous cyanobacterium LEGE 11480]|uniref:Uncharacterized protein n=1 Tax=Romeriopsis navalis LEGE 11480 TaxID=2777977 RepID=A0A928Z5Z8_9CYAN|nr:hypothetical protein [Romeriopsis navalis]MBE9032522.1 hypothetical protein [Romeriopsis navalis LEGE 11480]
MKLANWRRNLVAVLLVCTLWITGCQAQAPSQFSQVQKETAKSGSVAVAKDATKGGEFNKFFPKATDGYDRVYTQEKKGFAEAKLKKDGKDVAMLAISDTRSIPGSAAKYANSTEKISGYPAVSIGNSQTSVLVGDYQVKVLSRNPQFTKEARIDWLSKFDLKGLSKLK